MTVQRVGAAVASGTFPARQREFRPADGNQREHLRIEHELAQP